MGLKQKISYWNLEYANLNEKKSSQGITAYNTNFNVACKKSPYGCNE
jgi:hypothetical protein